MDQFCPECGTGFEPRCDADPPGRILRLPKDYPFNHECQTCKLRSKERLEELGRKVARNIEEQVMEKVFG